MLLAQKFQQPITKTSVHWEINIVNIDLMVYMVLTTKVTKKSKSKKAKKTNHWDSICAIVTFTSKTQWHNNQQTGSCYPACFSFICPFQGSDNIKG